MIAQRLFAVLALMAATLSPAWADGESGKVRICRAPDAPRSPHGNSVIYQPGAVFYQGAPGEGESQGRIAIAERPVFFNDSASQSPTNRCAITAASVSGGDHRPKQGEKWQGIANDDGVKVPVVAEVVADFAFPKKGYVTICRHPGLTEMLDRQTVTVAKGSTFTNEGSLSELVVSITAEAKVPPKPGCTVVEAVVSEQSGSRAVTPASYKKLLAQFSVAGASLEATIKDGFR
jgi:hypothetical protein